MESARTRGSVCSLSRLRGRGGEGVSGNALTILRAPSLSLQPKSDVSDLGQSIKRPNSGKPEFGCKRGRGPCGAVLEMKFP